VAVETPEKQKQQRKKLVKKERRWIYNNRRNLQDRRESLGD
jgi:hypothetical protein